MGSNMQRHAVPLLRCTAPLVGTGMEKYVARDSGACLLSAGEGIVEEADANRVVIRYDKPDTDGFETGVAVYRLTKYKKSNQNTCFTQKAVILFYKSPYIISRNVPAFIHPPALLTMPASSTTRKTP